MEYYQPTPESLGVDTNVGHLLKLAVSSITRMADQAVAPLDLTAMQWRPLVVLRYRDINTPAELARLVNVDTGAMTRTLDRLEAKGFLTRQRGQEDRRVVLLTLTPSGHDVAAKILPAVSATLNTHLKGFSKSEVNQLVGYLQRIIVNGGLSVDDCGGQASAKSTH